MCLSPGTCWALSCPESSVSLQEGQGTGPGQHRGVPFPWSFPLCLPQSFLRQLDPSLPPWALSLRIQAVCLAQPGCWLFPVWDGCPGLGLPGSPPSLSNKGLGWDFLSWKEELLLQGFCKDISYF